MSDEDAIAPMLPIVSDAPKAPQRDDDIPAPKPVQRQHVASALPAAQGVQPVGTVEIDASPETVNARIDASIRAASAPDPNRYAAPVPQASPPPRPAAPQSHGDPWARVPLDLYWFTRTWSRSPFPEEYREWEFELVTEDNRRQRGRLLARIDGPFELALVKAKANWAEQMPPNVMAQKIMVLSS